MTLFDAFDFDIGGVREIPHEVCFVFFTVFKMWAARSRLRVDRYAFQGLVRPMRT
jgi:hypothetical protein